jgi:cob(I)alamin adenosyltransferase
MILSKIYTKGGDQGLTSLINGERVSKSDPRIECFGTLDELNASVGMLRTLCPSHYSHPHGILAGIQQHLFDAGSELACPAGFNFPGMSSIGSVEAKFLEDDMDQMLEKLDPLTSFVLPGGSQMNAWAHICRTQCRRAEREISALKISFPEQPTDGIIIYINRLSDWFFVFSRWISKMENLTEYLWQRPLNKPS